MRGALLAWVLAVAVLGAPGSPVAAQARSAPATATTVILVRHAEKLTEPSGDPPLSAVGHARARAIGELLARARVDASVDAVYVSPYERTRATAAPLASMTQVGVYEYDPRDSDALAARVLREHAGQTVLVVGHSNTLPALGAAFGVDPALPPIADLEYDNLYVLSVPGGEGPGSTSVLRLTLPAAFALRSEPAPVPGRPALAAAQAWHLAREHFLDADAVSGPAWEEAFAKHIAPLPAHADATRASAAINAMLATLDTSHTSHYTRLDTAWYQLLGIFGEQFPSLLSTRFAEQGGEVTYAGLPIAVEREEGRVFVAGLYRPLQLDGEQSLLVGDELLSVDGEPFDEIAPFSGKVGQTVRLGVRREAKGPVLEVRVRVEALRPSQLFLRAIDAGAKLFSGPHGEGAIAYVPMWSYAGVVYHDALRALLRRPPYAHADALVLDLRGGWGGADPSYADYFLSRTASIEMTTRMGEHSTYNDHWHRPLVVLVDGGTRSGKEVLAHTLQDHGVTLVGARTSGAVTAGRPFVLVDDSLLYLAVGAVRVDGEALEAVGVTPDVSVARALAYAAGADPQLERAVAQAASLIRGDAKR